MSDADLTKEFQEFPELADPEITVSRLLGLFRAERRAKELDGALSIAKWNLRNAEDQIERLKANYQPIHQDHTNGSTNEGEQGQPMTNDQEPPKEPESLTSTSVTNAPGLVSSLHQDIVRLQTKGLSQSEIAAELTKVRGKGVSQQTVSYHGSGACSCSKPIANKETVALVSA